MRTNYMRRMRDIVRSTRRKKGDVERDRGLDEKERARDDLAGASIFFDLDSLWFEASFFFCQNWLIDYNSIRRIDWNSKEEEYLWNENFHWIRFMEMRIRDLIL